MGHRLILSSEACLNGTCGCHEALWYTKPSELHYVATQVLTSVNILGTATGKTAVCAKLGVLYWDFEWDVGTFAYTRT